MVYTLFIYFACLGDDMSGNWGWLKLFEDTDKIT